MKTLTYSFLVIFLLGFLTSCDIIEGDKVDYTNLPAGSGNKVLIEDFTGHQCGNCPRAHEHLEDLQGTYGDQLIVIGIHAGGFANTFAALGYTADYTTPMGDDIEGEFDADNEGLPIGLVNRRVWPDGNALQKFATWSSQIATILGETPKLSIEIDDSLNPSETELSLNIDLEFFTAGTAELNLVVVLTEDSIFSKQSDYDLASGYVANYHHKHMLRASVTSGSWGEQIKTSAIVIGEKFTKTFTFPMDPSWNPNSMHVVAYVMDNTTKEILQAQDVHSLSH